MKAYQAVIFALGVAACRRDPSPNAASKTEDALTSQDRPRIVAPSPSTAQQMVLTDLTPIDVAVWPTGPDAAVLVTDKSGKGRVVAWRAGETRTTPIAELPSGFVPRGIAAHTTRRVLFVSGEMGGKSQILSLTQSGTSWNTAMIFETPNRVGHMLVSSRPFYVQDCARHRIFFAATLNDGSASLRSVAENGKVEYQIAGPKSGVVAALDTFPDPERPNGAIEPSAAPMSIHPRGEPLLWQDGRGCAHASTYADKNWQKHELLTGVPCGGVVSITPNGAAYLQWRSGQSGISVLRADGRAPSQQAGSYTFRTAPISTPDGKGVIGIVSNTLAFAPIDVPLGDVANVWQLAANACEEERFVRDGGLFRGGPAGTAQLYSLYDHMNYAGYPSPLLVTTDLFWENFGAAFGGTMILLERRFAMNAFWSFVQSANEELSAKAPTSLWGKTFAAVAALKSGAANPETQRILKDSVELMSSVLDSMYNFAELKPRGHYTSDDEVKQYFRAVHYLTQISQLRDPAPLATLSPETQKKALEWIDVYRSFTAAPRAPLVWKTNGATPALAAYAKRPWQHATLFPLSWGLDNEILESTVYHSGWPEDEQIAGPRGGRRFASGVDVAAAYGGRFARSVLARDIADFPRLGPVLDGLASRRPTIGETSSLYDRWVDALAQEWADSAAFPSAPTTSKLWPAKRLQTGLASWATLREATILVNERPMGSEGGEGGFEELIPEMPHGYVEPVPKTFDAIASLYDALAKRVQTLGNLGAGGSDDNSVLSDKPLQDGLIKRLNTSAAEARRFARMAERELKGEALADSDYVAIRGIGGAAEHQFLLYKSLGNKDLAITLPDPMPKIADVAGDYREGLVEAAVGGPLTWTQIVPYFGRRQIAIGSVYSYYELTSSVPYDNERWRKEVDTKARPAWMTPFIATCATNER
jgi:hypothetical protein